MKRRLLTSAVLVHLTALIASCIGPFDTEAKSNREKSTHSIAPEVAPQANDEFANAPAPSPEEP